MVDDDLEGEPAAHAEPDDSDPAGAVAALGEPRAGGAGRADDRMGPVLSAHRSARFASPSTRVLSSVTRKLSGSAVTRKPWWRSRCAIPRDARPVKCTTARIGSLDHSTDDDHAGIRAPSRRQPGTSSDGAGSDKSITLSVPPKAFAALSSAPGSSCHRPRTSR